MIVNKLKQFHPLVQRVLLLCIALLMGINTTTFAQQINVNIQTTQNGNIEYKISEKNSGNVNTYNIQLSNTDRENQNLKTIQVTFQPDVLIPDSTHYMIGAYAMQLNDGPMKQLITGTSSPDNYGMMYLLFKRGESDFLLIGVASWRSFLCKISTKNGVVHIQGEGDNKLLRPGQKIDFEKVVVLKNTSWQDILYQYADIITKENNIPPPPAVNWKGWATWDYYTQYFTGKDVDKNIKALEALNVHPNIIQIDGGWWKERGDYFEVRDNLPGGIKAIVKKIHDDGFKAGLHFDGFRALKGAKIAKEHPDYFIHTTDGSFLEKGKDVVSGDPLLIWDYSNPGASDYIKKVMKNARQNWGVDYFKIDFMRQGLYEGVSYLPVTNLERFRMGIDAMREGMGKDAYFLACSANFGSVIGLVDAIRVGGDIQPDFPAVKVRVAHTSGSFYFEPEISHVDPDYLVLRSEKENNPQEAKKKPSLTYKQAAMWSNYISIFGNIRLESDNITLLTPEKKDLIQRTFKMPFFKRVIPIDFWEHYTTKADAPCFYLSEAENGIICIGLFNWDENSAKFSVSGFKENAALQEFSSNKQAAISGGKFSVPLNGIQSVLLQYKGKETFDELRKQLKLNMYESTTQ